MTQLRLASTLQGYFTHCQGVGGCYMKGSLLSWLGLSRTPAVGKPLTSKTGRKKPAKTVSFGVNY